MKGFPQFQNLVDMATFRGASEGHREVMVFLNEAGNREGAFSFKGLDTAARQVAMGLIEKGLANRPVILLYAPGLDYISAFFGCLYAGAVPVPAYPPMGARDIERLRRIVVDCGAEAILTSSMLLPMIEAWVSNPSNGLQIPCLASDQFQNDSSESGFTPHNAEPDDLAFLQYTSGSTGQPKGVMVSHRNLLANFQQIVWAFAKTDDMDEVARTIRTVIWLPPFHDMGLIGGVLTPIYSGSPVTLMSPLTFLKNPFVWLKAITDNRATITGGPNFSYQYCARKIADDKLQELDLSSLEVAFNGAEPINMESLQAFTERFAQCGFNQKAFLPCYGLAEATLYVSGSPVGRGPRVVNKSLADITGVQGSAQAASDDTQARVDLVSSGKLALETQVKIVDPQTRRECVPGAVGEIWVNSPSVANGYLNKPSYSKSVFQARIKYDESGTSYMRTGDLGFMQDNELFVTGRIKELIIVSGRNHYPQDIEWTLQSASTDFRKGCGAAFSVTEEGKEQLVIMQEVGQISEQADFRKLALDGVKAVSSRHGISPKTIVFIASGTLPKTSSGKIQRTEARKLFTSGNMVPKFVWEASTVAPKSTVSLHRSLDLAEQAYTDWHHHLYQEMQAWVGDKLNMDPHHIDLGVPFSDLGVDSIEAIELVDTLQERIERTIPATELMRYPTVKSLIDHLAEEITEKCNQKLDELATADTDAD